MHRINALLVVVGKMAGMTPGDLFNIHGSGMSPQEQGSAMLKRPRHNHTPLVLEPDLPADVVSHPASISRDVTVVQDELRSGGNLLERVQLKALEVLANGQYLHTSLPTTKRHQVGMNVPCCTS